MNVKSKGQDHSIHRVTKCMRPDSPRDFGAIQIIYLLTYLLKVAPRQPCGGSVSLQLSCHMMTQPCRTVLLKAMVCISYALYRVPSLQFIIVSSILITLCNICCCISMWCAAYGVSLTRLTVLADHNSLK